MTEAPAPKKKRKKRAKPKAPAGAPARAGAERGKELAVQRLMALAATVAVVGLYLVGISASEIGAWLVIAGALALAFGIHRFGRLGIDPGR